MIDLNICEWLMRNAGAPIRYRVAREFLHDEGAAKNVEPELLENDAVKTWLKYLKPETPPQHWSMEHGSFDFNLENALLKSVQLGLHAALSPLDDAVQYYLYKMNALNVDCSRKNSGFQLGDSNLGFYSILTTNLLMRAGFNDTIIVSRMLESLDVLYGFVSKGDYEIYACGEERDSLKAVPAIWKDKKFIKRGLVEEHGFCYPLIYDIVGLYKLYGLAGPETDKKIDAVIEYISTDEFHNTIADGYGILISGGRKYHAMGWDPKYPGWFDVQEYFKKGDMPKLLFFAECISKYPVARKTKWYQEYTKNIKKYRNGDGRYEFPAGWLKERQGYAVMGSHMSFGENRRNKNWREVESTFYMLLLSQYNGEIQERQIGV